MRQGVIPMGTVKHEKTVARATWAYVGDSTSVSGTLVLVRILAVELTLLVRTQVRYRTCESQSTRAFDCEQQFERGEHSQGIKRMGWTGRGYAQSGMV